MNQVWLAILVIAAHHTSSVPLQRLGAIVASEASQKANQSANPSQGCHGRLAYSWSAAACEGEKSAASAPLFSEDEQRTMDVSSLWGKGEGYLPLLRAMWGGVELRNPGVKTAMGPSGLATAGISEKTRWLGPVWKRGQGKAKPVSPRRRGKGNEAKNGPKQQSKGSGKEQAPPAPVVPTLDGLPKPPSAQNMALPAAASSSGGGQGASSVTESTLQALLQALSKNRDDLPPAVREMVDSQMVEESKQQAKSLHRLVAAQGAAKRQLATTKAARQDYMREWSAYVGGILDLWQKQLAEKTTAIEAFMAAEQQWESQLQETSQMIAKVAADADNVEAIDVDAMEEEEERANEHARMDAQRQAALDTMRLAESKITESLQEAAKTVEQQAAELIKPERERSPRRKQPRPPEPGKVGQGKDGKDGNAGSSPALQQVAAGGQTPGPQ